MDCVRSHPTRKVCLWSGWQELGASLGRPVADILAEAGLPAELAREEHVEMTREQFFRFWNALLANKSLREAADWCLGFFDAVLPAPYLAALCSRDLQTGFARLAEYKALFGPKQMSLEPCGGGLSVVCDWQVDDAPGSLYFVDLCVLRHLAMRGAGRPVTPLRAEIPNAENVPEALARELLGVPVEAGPVMRLTFAEADLGAQFNTSNPTTLRMLEDGLQQHLFTISDRWAERLKFTFKRLLPDRRDRIVDAAAEMSCAPRALQRQLAAEGTSFREVLDDTRRELAMFYLGKVRFSPREVGFMLGYSEPSAFYNAFRRWTGRSPSEYANSPNAPNFLMVKQ